MVVQVRGPCRRGELRGGKPIELLLRGIVQPIVGRIVQRRGIERTGPTAEQRAKPVVQFGQKSRLRKRFDPGMTRPDQQGRARWR